MVLAMATTLNGKAGHMSDIMFISNKFKEVRRAVGSTDADWTNVMEYENGISMSVQLDIRGDWERFTIKALEREHSLRLGLCFNND